MNRSITEILELLEELKNSQKIRIDTNSLSEEKIDSYLLYGPATAQALNAGEIDILERGERIRVKEGMLIVKEACALANQELRKGDTGKLELVAECAKEVRKNIPELLDHFPLGVFHTGSGTATNMNANEVISNYAHIKQGGSLADDQSLRYQAAHPNDIVNASQSSNDTYPTAMRIAAVLELSRITLPGLHTLRASLEQKAKQWEDEQVILPGRTHGMDAMPIGAWQWLGGFVGRVGEQIENLETSLKAMLELPIGGTAVGTGINCPDGFDDSVVKYVNKITELEFKSSNNKFVQIAAHDSFVSVHGVLNTIGTILLNLSNDLRDYSAGPRTGISEMQLRALAPGSSIMPGKVNPILPEMARQVACSVAGNHTTITMANASCGHTQLGVGNPIIIDDFLSSATAIGEIATAFANNCIKDLEINIKNVEAHLGLSPSLATVLNEKLGYDQVAAGVKLSIAKDMPLKQVFCEELSLITSEDYDQIVDPRKMV